MKKVYKIILWSFLTFSIYFVIYKSIIYIDPTNTNIRGIKSLLIEPGITVDDKII